MKYPDRTAFIISNPQMIAEILGKKPGIFRIFLVGEKQVHHANVTMCAGRSFHDIAILICREMLQRRLRHVVSDQPNRLMEQKVLELIGSSCNFALGGGIQNALENLWGNLAFLPGSRSVDAIQNKFQGTPGILVASGPSLQKNIHLLNDLKNCALLISCGSALGPLRQRNIVPHFEIVVDPNPVMFETLKPYLDSPVCFLLSLMTHAGISRNCSGPRMFFLPNFQRRALEDIQRFSGIRSVLPAMASVATTALFFALHAGCNPIIFVGQDLCYTGGQMHIDGGASPADAGILETLDGRHVRSSPAMMEAFDFYRDFIPTIKDRTFLNATEGGAGVPGAEPLSLAEAAAQYLTRPIAFPELPELKTDKDLMETRLRELRNSLNAMNVKAAGFRKKIRAQLERSMGETAAGVKIGAWFETLRGMPGYEYLSGYLDWAFYKADTQDGLADKMELLASTTAILQQQMRLIGEALEMTSGASRQQHPTLNASPESTE